MIWNGSIAFGLMNIPKKMYAAIDRRSVSLKLLHQKDNSPIEYRRWCAKLDNMSTDQPLVPISSSSEVIWVRPEVVCEVEYLEVTLHGHLRAPLFRHDKTPAECTTDQLL